VSFLNGGHLRLTDAAYIDDRAACYEFFRKVDIAVFRR
jgi:hypothetical protein